VNLRVIAIIFFISSLIVTILPVFAVEETRVIISEIDDKIFKAAMNSTIISTNGSIIGKLEIKNPEEIGHVFILEEKNAKNSMMIDQTTMSIILAISTAVLAAVGVTSLIYNRKMVSEMKIEREYNLRPFVICDVTSKPSTTLSIFYIVIHNQGKGPAKNIRIKLTSDHMILKGKNEFKHEIHLLGPNGKSEINMGVLALSENVAKINVELDYIDVFDKSFHDESEVALSSLFGY